MAVKVFVYGTLKPGEAYYPTYCAGRVAGQWEAIALGHLYALPLGYPAMTPGDSSVYGFLLTLTDTEALRELDEFEGYDPRRLSAQNEYERQWIDVFGCDRTSLGKAWAYIMTPAQAQALGGIFLPTGVWTGKQDYF